jgi:hypothetical protein
MAARDLQCMAQCDHNNNACQLPCGANGQCINTCRNQQQVCFASCNR